MKLVTDLIRNEKTSTLSNVFGKIQMKRIMKAYGKTYIQQMLKLLKVSIFNII